MQLDALDEMYTGLQGFDQLGKDVLQHVKEKWGELDAAEQKSVQDLKDNSEVLASVLTPITSAFETSFTGIIQGTQSATLAFQTMTQSIVLEMVKSGLRDLLLGGAKNTFGAEIFGTTGQGGGLAGQIVQAFQGSAISTALKSSLTSAWTSLTAPITNVFGSAFRGIEGIINNVFGTALGSATSIAGGAVGAASSATTATAETTLSAALTLATPPMTLLGPALTAAAPAMTSLAAALAAAGIGVGIFEKGGIVPSAAGGMISGGGLSILHPREAVLPANLTGFLMAAAGQRGGGDSGGGGEVNVNIAFNISALDGNSAHQVIMANSDSIGQAVARSIRNNAMRGGNTHWRSAGNHLRR